MAVVLSASIFSAAEGTPPSALMLQLIALEAVGACGVVVGFTTRAIPIARVFHGCGQINVDERWTGGVLAHRSHHGVQRRGFMGLPLIRED